MNQTIVGHVTSVAAEKTIAVRVDRRVSHPLYKKQFNRTKKFVAHDAKDEAAVGDLVEIQAIRPVSKTKSWKLTKVIEKAKVLGGTEGEK